MTSSAPAPTPGAQRALWLLAVSLVLSMTTWFSASAVIPQLRAEWSLSTAAVSWLTIAVQLGFVAGALFSAFLNLSDLVPARVLIVAGAAGAALANLALTAAAGSGSAIPLRFLTGAFLAAVYPPAFKLMSTWFVQGRGVALGILAGAISVGSAGPHLVNGLGGLDTDFVIVTTSALTLAGGLLVLAVREGPYPFPRAVFDPGQVRVILANRGVRLASLGYFGHMWELFAMWAWFATFFGFALGQEGSSTAAYATFAVIAIGGLGSWVGGILGDRWGRTPTTMAMLIVSGTCSLSIGLLLGGPTWLIFVVSLVWGFTVIGDSAQFSTMVTELGDQAYVGTALTLQLAVGFTLTVATIALIPVLVDAVTWRWAFAFLAPGPALGAVAMLRLGRLPEASLIASGKG